MLFVYVELFLSAEAYMEDLNDFIESNMAVMKSFIDNISV